MKEYELGIFIGRFQPFHKGHMHALRQSMSLCRKLVIGIGSSQDKGTDTNPLSAADRVRVIRAALRGEGIEPGSVRFLLIPDFDDNDRWFEFIMKSQPGIGIVFSNNGLVRRIFREHGIAVAFTKWHNRRILQATRIRGRIKNGKSWKAAVPRGAIKVLEAKRHAIEASRPSAGKKKG